MSAYKTGTYHNLFKEIGKTDEQIEAKLQSIVNTFFYGSEEERIYHPAGEDMGYLVDTGNIDARTEGMSYGMMMCVQLDMKEEFDRIWKWACTYMWMDEGTSEGYFAWSCALDGSRNADGAAPDGEEFFAMALFFASHRWGDGEGIFAYSECARKILRACVHKGSNGRIGHPMFHPDNKQILFVPGSDFTDPSYHLPHFYELFALWADEEDRPFFKEAAKVSREYLKKACHPVTGMNAEYGEFDGSPMSRPLSWTTDRHDWFYSDAYRTVANIGLDKEWFDEDLGQYDAAKRLIRFLDAKEDPWKIYEVDGTDLNLPALHPVGMFVTTCQGILAFYNDTDDMELRAVANKWLEKFFDMPLRDGVRRYYDNCLYLFAFLALSGKYRIW